jgi:hypothetical protein
VTDHEIDKRFAGAAYPVREVSPAVLDRITVALHSSLKPVRALPGSGLLVSGVLLIGAAVALADAVRGGLFGFKAMGVVARISVLCALAALGWLTAQELVSQWIPGSRRYLAPPSLVALASGALLLVFGLEFSDYRVEHFFSAGIICLGAGVAHAIVAACLVAWFLRRGCALNLIAAGAVAGVLGGISGVAMLELHCPNLEAAHVLVWHVAVVPVSAVAGALIGWVVRAWSDYLIRRSR